VIQNILYSRKADLPVDIIIEYSETGATAKMVITYGGTLYNPLTEGDELSMMIVRKFATSVTYDYKEENCITVTFK
jgi:hypothetical protein